MAIKTVLLAALVLLFFSFASNGQSLGEKQENTTGSDIFVDVPHTINFLNDTVIPISVYIHESNCFNCTNDLAFIDIRLKDAIQTSYNNILDFNALSYVEFISMFSEYSYDNSLLETQSFLNALPERDSDHSIIFTADTNWWIPVVPIASIEARYFYFTFNLPLSYWENYTNNGAIDISVKVGIDYETDPELFFRVFVTDQAIPNIPGIYRGDAHYHAINTQNDAENGFPLKPTKRAAKILGIDWITTTDHSCDYDNYGTSMQANWQQLGDEIQVLNNEDSSFIFIRSVEASVKNSADNTVHALVYPNPEHPFDIPFIFDGGGDVFSTTVNISKMCDSLQLYQGFCYAAHPFSEGDELSFAVDGGVWNLNDPLYPENGEPCPPIGTIIWNDLSSSSDIYSPMPGQVFRSEIKGGEIYNMFNYLSCDDTQFDPWNTNYETEPFGFLPVDPLNKLSYRFEQNFHTYSFLLKKGLIEKSINHACNNWKFFMSGGSDAHGSFNYSSTEYIAGGIMGQMTENAPGKMVTLTYCPNGMGVHGQHVLEALRDGHTAISTGPVMYFSIQTPNITVIPGDDIDLSLTYSEDVLLQITAQSNNDYGDLQTVKFHVYTAYGELQTISYPISSGSLEISLQTLELDLNAAGTPLPVDSYCCILAEITTNKTYNPQEAIIRKINALDFYCKTNPIWVKTQYMVNASAQNSSTIKTYPNPAKDFVICENISTEQKVEVEIIGITGQIIHPNFTQEGQRIIIHTQDLTNGIYTVRILEGSNMNCFKIAIVK
ncbi:MAG: hypothetical protein CVU05_10040 [Bacteroidetes bacterium HGW-Bacteroidetes-21]|nr:MAG: hypothetical protein CVU05_10040 [Bacteroidetes bacterium HGW-Bacteroidetes-21]